MPRAQTSAKCLEMSTEPLAQVNWGQKLRRTCLIHGVSKLPEWLKERARAGESVQQSPRSRARGQTVHMEDTAGRRLVEMLQVRQLVTTGPGLSTHRGTDVPGLWLPPLAPEGFLGLESDHGSPWG